MCSPFVNYGTYTAVIFLQQLINAGAKGLSMIFLECDFDSHMDAVWKCYLRLVDQSDTILKKLWKGWGLEGIVGFKSFLAFKKMFGLPYQEPLDLVKHFMVIDNTAKCITDGPRS